MVGDAMPIDVKALGRSWELACGDAEIATPAEARLYYLPGDMDSFQGAFHLHPGSFAVYEGRFPFTRSQLEDANRADHRDMHRIAIRDTPEEPTAVVLLRHELEHARQFRHAPLVYAFVQVAQDALSLAFESVEPAALAGSATLYNVLPHETDANCAAAACARKLFGNDVSASRGSGPYGQLFRDAEPPSLPTLATRLVAFCALFPQYAERAAARQGGIVSAIDRLAQPEVSQWWATTRLLLGLDAYGDRALSATPSVDAVAAADEAGDAWRPARQVLVDGLAQALPPR
jgi:hypothetical protein